MAFKCSTQKQRENTGQRRAGRKETPMSASADHGMSGSTCLGADMLLQLLKKYSLASGMKQAITVGELLILFHLISLSRLTAYSLELTPLPAGRERAMQPVYCLHETLLEGFG